MNKTTAAATVCSGNSTNVQEWRVIARVKNLNSKKQRRILYMQWEY